MKVVGNKILAVSCLIGSILFSLGIFEYLSSYFQEEDIPKFISIPLFIACISLMGFANRYFFQTFSKKK